MSALNADITHGEGLGILLPAALRELYPAAPEILAEILAPIAPGLTGIPGEAATASDTLRDWLGVIGQPTSMLAHKGDILFGRYWGAFEDVPFLHFELCYYAPIAWAIAHGLKRYDPGMVPPGRRRRSLHPTLVYQFSGTISK